MLNEFWDTYERLNNINEDLPVSFINKLMKQLVGKTSLPEICEILNKNWKPKFTVLDLNELNWAEDSDKLAPELQECISDSNSIKLIGDDNPGTPDAFSRIDEIMRTLHYDNGKPLTTDNYNYFDHYDRDQDFWGFFSDEKIARFYVDYEDNKLYIVVDMTFDELKTYLTKAYDGSSYEHDFGAGWKDEDEEE